MKTLSRFLLGAMLAVVVNATAFAAPSWADDPVMHPVTYVITSASPIYADIYYLDQQPEKFSDYSHNTYQFTPHVNADIAPGHPWVSPTVMLSDPNDYAMVVVSTGTEPGTPQFHCALVVDGKVVVSNDGAKGVICSQRTW